MKCAQGSEIPSVLAKDTAIGTTQNAESASKAETIEAAVKDAEEALKGDDKAAIEASTEALINEPMWMTSQPLGYPSGPAHRPTVARLAGFKRRERTFDRSQLLCFQWIYERTGARHALFQLRTRVEARSAPGRR